jgi:RNA polymerase sigma-70 factor (ECF subfamily)
MNRTKNTIDLQKFVEQLYEEYRGLLLNTILRYLGSTTDCEDVFHEVFIRIIKCASRLIEFSPNKLKAYILLVAHGVSVDYIRKNYRNPEISMEDNMLTNVVNSARGMYAEPNTFKKVDLLLIMETVSAEERILLVGKYYLGLSGKELASLVGGSEATVRSQLHRAKKKVFNEWKKAGLSLEDFE